MQQSLIIESDSCEKKKSSFWYKISVRQMHSVSGWLTAWLAVSDVLANEQ